jgi:hypothetical protein
MALGRLLVLAGAALVQLKELPPRIRLLIDQADEVASTRRSVFAAARRANAG